MKRTEEDDFGKRYKVFGRNTVRQDPGATATGQKDATKEGNPILQLTQRRILDQGESYFLHCDWVLSRVEAEHWSWRLVPSVEQTPAAVSYELSPTAGKTVRRESM